MRSRGHPQEELERQAASEQRRKEQTARSHQSPGKRNLSAVAAAAAGGSIALLSGPLCAPAMPSASQSHESE